MSLFRIVPLLAALFLVTACSSQEDADPLANSTEQQLYESIQSSLTASQWEDGIKKLQTLESRFPFGRYAEQAQLELIYAYYQSFQEEAAIAAAERFIKLHPDHPKADYAYYMRGLASYTQSQSFLERFMPTDITQRDPGGARESFAEFQQLLNKYPNSQYAFDAHQRMIHLRNILARYELHVASYYFTRGAYVAALNRGQYVVENFPSTPAVPDALATMVLAYNLLDLPDQAKEMEQVLILNFPEYPLLKNGHLVMKDMKGINHRSWVNQLTFGLVDRPEPPGFDTRLDSGKERTWVTPKP